MRPEVEAELLESLRQIGPPPCDAFQCEYRPLCRQKELACSAFRKYSSDRGRSLAPRPAGERPTKIIWLEIFRPKATGPGGHRPGAGRKKKQESRPRVRPPANSLIKEIPNG